MKPSSALVTGARGSIGGSTVQRLRARGVRVAGIDKLAPGCDCISADVSEVEGRHAALAAARRSVGVIDVAIFAHGVYPRRPLSAYGETELADVVNANFGSIFHLCRLLLDGVAERPSRFIFVGSQAAVAGGFDPAYAASKAAVTALAKSLAREFGPAGIVCNVVSPGPVDTPMASVMGDDRRRYYEQTIPLQRFATADEVSAAIEWLALDANGVSGATIDVDGGLMRR